MNYVYKSIEVIVLHKRYLWLGLAYLFAGALMGYLNAELIKNVAYEMMKELERIASKIEHHDSMFYTFWVIFKNNTLASLTMLGLGVFFGIFPALALLSNGMLLGFILKTYAQKGMDPISLLIFGILPHGIIELFAVALAAGVGMKLGLMTFRLLINVINKDKRASILQEFTSSFQYLPYLVGSIIFLLLVAAVIESVITPLLIKTFIGQI